MSKVIEALRSAVEHRERISLDDIDVANILYVVDSDTELMRQALNELEQPAACDWQQVVDALRERLK